MKKPTAIKIQKIKEIWKKGMTADVIAEKIGVTRSSIIGIFSRHGAALFPCVLSTTNTTKAKLKDAELKKKAARVLKTPSKPKVKVHNGVIIMPPPTREKYEAAPLPQGFKHLTLMQLKENSCRFPTGDSNFTFCGKLVVRGRYCDYHSKLVIPAPRQTIQIRDKQDSLPKGPPPKVVHKRKTAA